MCIQSVRTYTHVQRWCWLDLAMGNSTTDYLQCLSLFLPLSVCVCVCECFWEWKNVMQFMFVEMIYSYTCVTLVHIASNIFRALASIETCFCNGMCFECAPFLPCNAWAIFYCCCWLKRSQNQNQNQNISTLKTRSNFNEVIIVDFLVLCRFFVAIYVVRSAYIIIYWIYSALECAVQVPIEFWMYSRASRKICLR